MKTRVFKMSNCSQYKPHARVYATAIYKYIQTEGLFIFREDCGKAKRRVDKREEMETSAFFFFFVFFFLIFQGK